MDAATAVWPGDGMKHKNRWKSIRALLWPFRGNILLLNLCAGFQSLSHVGLAVFTKTVVDAALAKDGTLPYWGIGLVVLLVLMVGNYVLYAWKSGSTSDRCMAHLRKELLKSAVYSQEAQLQAYHSGELLSRGMEDVRSVCDGVVRTLPSMTGQVLQLVGSFVAVVLMCPSITPVLILAGVAVIAISAGLRPIMRRRHAEVRKTEDRVMADLQEELRQLELIQSLQAQKQIRLRFANSIRADLAAKTRRRFWSVGSGTFISTVSLGGTGLLLLWGAVRVAAGALSYGSLSALLQLLALFRGPVLGLSGQWTQLAATEVAADRLMELLAAVPEQEEGDQKPLTVEAVVFENVTFRYPGDEAAVVCNFNASFPLEQWACLTGISGKGKSTLFKLMLGLYTPEAGRVFLKTKQGDISCSGQTRHLFAYVPQDYALFSGTIEENLLLVAPDADEDSCRKALEIAEAAFVWELSHQEQTQVRENNAGLSKGQLQRLAIARAVLMDRPIFLLDECTSALDAQTETYVLQNLHAMGKQAILVTHRPEAVGQLEQVAFVNMDM